MNATTEASIGIKKVKPIGFTFHFWNQSRNKGRG